MKMSIGVVVVALAVGGGMAFSQGQDPKDELSKKVVVLEGDLVATRLKAEATAAELGEVKATLAKVVEYLDKQAKSAEAMATVLDDSEQAGFTAGINPNSRMILLSGWRDQLTVVQTDVPVMLRRVEAVKPVEKKAK
jgi:hypothetical protein